MTERSLSHDERRSRKGRDHVRGKYSSVLLATEESFQESEIVKRLSESCNVIIARDRWNIEKEIELRAIPFSAYIIDTSDIDKSIIDCIELIKRLDQTDGAPIILIVDDISDDLINQGFNAGATDGSCVPIRCMRTAVS